MPSNLCLIKTTIMNKLQYMTILIQRNKKNKPIDLNGGHFFAFFPPKNLDFDFLLPQRFTIATQSCWSGLSGSVSEPFPSV